MSTVDTYIDVGVGSGGGGSGAPTTSTYVTQADESATLTNSRRLAAGANITLTDGGAGSTLTIASTGGGGGNTTGWADGVGKMKTTGSISIDASNNYADGIGTDNFFYVSGTIGLGQGTAGRKVANFGGDVRSSGSIHAVRTLSGTFLNAFSASIDPNGSTPASDVQFFVSGSTGVPKTDPNHKHALFGGGVDSSGSFTTYAAAGGEYRVSGSTATLSSLKTTASGTQGNFAISLHDGTTFRKTSEMFALQKQTNTTGQQSVIDFPVGTDEAHLYVVDTMWRSGSGGAQGSYSYSFQCRRTGSTNVSQMGITNPIFPSLSDDPTWGTGFTVNATANTVSLWVSGATGATVNFFLNVTRTVW